MHVMMHLLAWGSGVHRSLSKQRLSNVVIDEIKKACTTYLDTCILLEREVWDPANYSLDCFASHIDDSCFSYNLWFDYSGVVMSLHVSGPHCVFCQLTPSIVHLDKLLQHILYGSSSHDFITIKCYCWSQTNQPDVVVMLTVRDSSCALLDSSTTRCGVNEENVPRCIESLVIAVTTMLDMSLLTSRMIWTVSICCSPKGMQLATRGGTAANISANVGPADGMTGSRWAGSREFVPGFRSWDGGGIVFLTIYLQWEEKWWEEGISKDVCWSDILTSVSRLVNTCFCTAGWV